MIEKILKLYSMYMAYDVRSPMPHLFGPPGTGKSTVMRQAAELIGVDLHTINVSRLSPLELEGVQMPVTHGDNMKLELLHATFWTQLKEGDILLMDEFLRGFPEVYNGLLDIFTSREVAGFKLPKVFIIAASNSTIAYDQALTDRLLHITVPDLRTNKTAKADAARMIVDTLGLMPSMATSYEMQTLLDTEVAPMYEMLDSVRGTKGGAATVSKGSSLRNLIGQAQLREVQSAALTDLIQTNNTKAMNEGKCQYVVLLNGKAASLPGSYVNRATQIKDSPKLTELQRTNIRLNLELVELETIRNQKEGDANGNVDQFDDLFD